MKSSRNPTVAYRSNSHLPAEDSNWRSDFWQGKSGGTWHLWNLEISDVGDPISLVQWRFGAFLELGFFRGKNWGAGLKPVDKDSYSQVWLVFLVKVDHLPARQQGGSFKMSVLVATFLAARFFGCQNAKPSRKRSIFERQGRRMLLFWRISMAGIFFGWKKDDHFSFDETGFRSLEGFVVGFLFPCVCGWWWKMRVTRELRKKCNFSEEKSKD